ncbi:hypothetical protein BAQ53_11325 [Bacillus sp. B25(2016b)]|nr:hypothetical protein BAQ53_11325 [Bacillus sp. B25(2016b)]
MRQNQILSKVGRKKKKYISGAEPVVAPHRLERQFDASAPNERWFRYFDRCPVFGVHFKM